MASTRVRAGQLIVAEVVLVLLVVAYAGPVWFFVGVLAAVGAVLVATFGRVDGRWYYEAAFTYRRFLRRRARVAAELVAATISTPFPDGGLTWLRTIAPDLRIRSVSGRGPSSIGVGSDEHGWFGAVATDGELSHATLGRLLREGTASLSSAQALLRPDGRLSYLSVRLSAPDAVELERAQGLPALDAAIGNGVHRLARLLHEHGLPARVLDEHGLLAALAEANALDAPPQEHWTNWTSGSRAHSFYLVASAAAVPRLDVVQAISVTADGAWGMLVRVSAAPGSLGRATREFTAAARTRGLRLRRLDGDHGPHAYVCSPSGLAALDLMPAGLDRAAAGRFPGLFAASLGSFAPGSSSPRVTIPDEVEQIER
jgi:Putative type VII ESX secretion system translocon, EccE